MKTILIFLKIAAQGGLLVLLPVLLFILLLTEIVQMVVGLATPIADLFPAGTFADPKYPVMWAIILIFGVSLLIGIAMKSNTVKRLGNWIEEKTVGKLTLYKFVNTLVSGLMGTDNTAGFKPALFDSGNGLWEFIYVVEDMGDKGFTALFPHAPTGFAGPVKIVPKDRIFPLDASLGDVSLVMNHMGLGAGRLLKRKEAP